MNLRAIAGLLPLSVDGHIAVRDQRCSLIPRELSVLGDKQIEANVVVRLDYNFLLS